MDREAQQRETDIGSEIAGLKDLAWCRYCVSLTECRGSAWTTKGSDLERFERNHSPARRAQIATARRLLKGEP